MESDKKNKLIDAAGAKVKKSRTVDADVKGSAAAVSSCAPEQKMSIEVNGPKGLEPTRYGDWEQKGRCTDF